MFEIKKQFYKPIVGISSLLGITLTKDTIFPIRSGNYCSLDGGPYLVNIWAENLTEWSRRNPDVDKIEVTVITDNNKSIGIVTDNRMMGWLNDRTCVTGHGWPSQKAKQECGVIMLGLIIDNIKRF